MSSAPGKPPMRLTVALKGERLDAELLETFARLAAMLEAELSGLFIEDDELLRIAALPVARAYTFAGAPDTLDSAALERRLQKSADEARIAFARIAESFGARWHFAVARGETSFEGLRAAARDTDLLAFGVCHAHRFFQVPLPSAGRPAARSAGGPVGVVFTGTSTSGRALEVATRIADNLRRGLMVFVVAAGESDADTLKAKARRLLGAREARFDRLVDPDVAGLREAARKAQAALLLMESDPATLDRRAVRALNDELSCPILLVR